MESHMAVTEDIVRYLRGKGTARMIERTLPTVNVDFKVINGKMELFIRGQRPEEIELAKDKIQHVIDTGLSQVMTLSYHQASTLCKTHPAEIVNRFRDNTILVGWHVDRRSNNLRLFADGAEQLSTAFILLLVIVCESSNRPRSKRPVMQQVLLRQEDNFGIVRSQGDCQKQGAASYKATHPIGELEMEKFRYLRSPNVLRITGGAIGVRLTIGKINRRSHIIVEGDQPVVEQALVRIKENIDAFCVEEITRDQEFIACLNELTNKEIVSALKKANVTAGWDIRERSLWLCSISKPNVSKAAEAIINLVTTGEYPHACDLCDSQLRAISTSSGWLDLSNVLAEAHPEVHFWHDEDFRKVRFATKRIEFDCKEDISKLLESFFLSFEIKQIDIHIPPDKARFVQRYKNEFDQAWHKLTEHPDTIELSDLSLVLKSTSDSALKRAETHACVMISNIKSKTTYATRRAQIAWLKTSEALARLNDISLRTTTVFDIYDPPTPRAESPAASYSSCPIPRLTSPETTGITPDTFKLVYGDISISCHEICKVLLVGLFVQRLAIANSIHGEIKHDSSDAIIDDSMPMFRDCNRLQITVYF